jgi:hypothetical protein
MTTGQSWVRGRYVAGPGPTAISSHQPWQDSRAIQRRSHPESGVPYSGQPWSDCVARTETQEVPGISVALLPVLARNNRLTAHHQRRMFGSTVECERSRSPRNMVAWMLSLTWPLVRTWSLTTWLSPLTQPSWLAKDLTWRPCLGLGQPPGSFSCDDSTPFSWFCKG